jgi:hypothetical protein
VAKDGDTIQLKELLGEVVTTIWTIRPPHWFNSIEAKLKLAPPPSN